MTVGKTQQFDQMEVQISAKSSALRIQIASGTQLKMVANASCILEINGGSRKVKSKESMITTSEITAGREQRIKQGRIQWRLLVTPLPRTGAATPANRRARATCMEIRISKPSTVLSRFSRKKN